MVVHRALVLHAGALGDFVLVLRVVQALRAAGAEFLALTGHASHVALAGETRLVDLAIPWESGLVRMLFDAASDPASAQAAPWRGFDLAVNMMAGGSSGLAGARLARLTGGRVIDIDPSPRPDFAGHVTDQWLSDLAAAGVVGVAGPPRLRLAEDAIRAGARRPDVVVHPGSGGRRKCWPVERFFQTIRRMEQAGRRTCVVLGPVELETWPREEIERFGRDNPCVLDPTLAELARLLSGTRAYLGNDSGVTHLAAALGVPTVAVFGPTDPVRWRPLGAHVQVVHSADVGEPWPSVQTVTAVLQSALNGATSGAAEAAEPSDRSNQA